MIKKDELVALLKEKVLTVNFKKKDDTMRKMVCTLSEEYLPELEIKENVKPRKENIDVIKAWDVEKRAWRSFRFDSLVDYDSNL